MVVSDKQTRIQNARQYSRINETRNEGINLNYHILSDNSGVISVLPFEIKDAS